MSKANQKYTHQGHKTEVRTKPHNHIGLNGTGMIPTSAGVSVETYRKR